ncbi:MAG: 4a-hydroxytetrahydrobiopterin dehydratase [Bdellovibrionaceae bacterium]|nr:4a-hydroxytetrahydrobiopterin dehydratase [Pseudobdellovibrionaceae bacterium]
MIPYETHEVNKALENLQGWSYDGASKSINKKYTFEDFNEAFGFMSRIAMYAESKGHHPEWFNVYNRVEVVLSTHDALGVTQKDIDMARFMDQVVQ